MVDNGKQAPHPLCHVKQNVRKIFLRLLLRVLLLVLVCVLSLMHLVLVLALIRWLYLKSTIRNSFLLLNHLW